MWKRPILIIVIIGVVIMVHGQADFGAYAAKKTVGSMADNAELAARLGSIVTFDRRGDIVWLDNFEGDVDKWGQFPDGVGSEIVISPDAARNGSFSGKLTTGNLENDSCRIRHYSPLPATSRIGFEISFTSNNDLKILHFIQTVYDGSYEHTAKLQYFPATDVLYYLNHLNAPVVLATDLILSPFNYVFHTIKIVIDLDTYKYVRAILDEVEYDMSAFGYYHPVEPAVEPHWEQEILITTGVDSNESIHIDDAIATQNEP